MVKCMKVYYKIIPTNKFDTLQATPLATYLFRRQIPGLVYGTHTSRLDIVHNFGDRLICCCITNIERYY